MMPPVMSYAPMTPPIMLDAPHHDGGIINHCKTHLNIDIYPCTLFFFENIGHKYDFQGGGVGGWSNSKETNFFYQINSYLLNM